MTAKKWVLLILPITAALLAAAGRRAAVAELAIEYAPQRDEPGNQVHTIYRDPTNDYGRALAK